MITIYDTTLRDGTQGEGINLTVDDKLRIATLLDQFGIQIIEGGWPGSNPKDAEFFERIREVPLQQARIAAFGSTCRPKLAPDEDDNLQKLIESQTPVTTIFGKTWTRHVLNVLRTELENNLRLIRESVAFLKAAGREVIFDAEHFFDGYNEAPDYALSCLNAAIEGGADALVLCDTNGGMWPTRLSQVVREVAEEFSKPLGIHAHNDSGCAVANSLSAVEAGCVQVQGTVNGYGERCGNADLSSIIPNLQLKLGHEVVPPSKLEKLTELSRCVSEIANVSLPRTAPYVGRSAFAHKAGVHVSAIQRDPGSYEHANAEAVGNATRVLVSELSGRSNLMHKAKEYGLDESDTESSMEVLSSIKKMENEGFAFEAAEASIELLMRRSRSDYMPLYELIDFMVVVEHREKRGHLVEAMVKIRIGDQVYHTCDEGVGPVGALDGALRRALRDVYPAVDQIRLVDYKVRILDSNSATGAQVRVMIDTTDGQNTWSTVGASRNIIEASWQALADSMEYGLRKAGEETQETDTKGTQAKARIA